MRVLIACETSGVERRAFRALGHDAWSCDILPAEDGGEHIQEDVRKHLRDGWDLMIAHPPCTHLATSGARWFKGKLDEQQFALDFAARLLCAPIPRIGLENPMSVISTWIRPADQVIQPHEYGHPEFKTTWLWLKELPPLMATNRLTIPSRDSEEWKAWNKVHRAAPGPDRWRVRSRSYEGVAAAMAEQWGGKVVHQFALFALENQPAACLAAQETRLQPVPVDSVTRAA